MPNSAPLKKLKVKNYKAFKREHCIEINNLTLLFGYNNTGKSALVRALPLLGDSMSAQQPNFFTKSYLNYTSPSIRGGLLNDLITLGESRLSFGLEWEDGSALDFELKESGTDPEIMTYLEVTTDGHTHKYRPSIESEYELEDIADPTNKVTFKNLKLSPTSKINALFDDFSKSVHWISSTRVPPEREFNIGVGIPLEIMPNGSGVGPMILHLHGMNSPSIQDINSWLTKTCQREIFFGAMSKEASGSYGRTRVRLDTISKEKGLSHKIAILDSGEGIAQALPVVVLAAMAANGELGDNPVIAVEQPELHLHPQASVELANFIIKCIRKNDNIRFVLETHSESFLRALQIAILDTDLSPENFSCYWASKDNESSKLEKVDFDEEAHLSNSWPQEVFRESLNQAKELVKLRQEKATQ